MRNIANFLVIAVLMVPIVSIANAGSESMSLGPFNVSFWLNTSEKYNVITSENDISGGVTQYKISVDNLRGEEKAYVAIERSETPQIKISPNTFAMVLENEWNKSYGEANSTLLMIDGYPGFLVTAKDTQNKSEAYGFGYWLDDRTIASGRSTYGWDNGSKSLVKTTHISPRIEEATAQKFNDLPFGKTTWDTITHPKSDQEIQDQINGNLIGSIKRNEAKLGS